MKRLIFCIYLSSTVLGFILVFHKEFNQSVDKSSVGAISSPHPSLNFEFMHELIVQKNCLSSPKSYLACVVALEKSLDFAPSALELVPGEATAVDKFLNLSVQDFGFAQIRRRISSSPEQFEQILQVERQISKEQTRKWLQLYRNGNGRELERILAWIQENILPGSEEQQLVLYMFNGYLSVVEDPHTQIFPVEQLQMNFGARVKNFGGFGIEVRRLGGHYYLQSILRDSPADRAQLRPFDVIRRLNGENIAKKSLQQILTMIQKNKILRFEIVRRDRVMEAVIHRAVNPMPASVNIEPTRDGEAHISIHRFAKGTCDELKHALQQISKSKYETLLLDFRDNPGGDLLEGICVTSLFIPENKHVLTLVDLNSNRVAQEYFSDNQNFHFAKRLRIAINSRTASTAEVVAAALQDHQRAIVIGEASYGKGTMQRAEPFVSYTAPNEEAQFIWLKTVATMVRPNGQAIHFRGITPDRAQLSLMAPMRLVDEPSEWPQQVLTELNSVATN